VSAGVPPDPLLFSTYRAGIVDACACDTNVFADHAEFHVAAETPGETAGQLRYTVCALGRYIASNGVELNLNCPH
jgi:hypothetical protein